MQRAYEGCWPSLVWFPKDDILGLGLLMMLMLPDPANGQAALTN
jgi:hypothetical protein